MSFVDHFSVMYHHFAEETKGNKNNKRGNVLGGVRANIVFVQKQWVLHNLSACICSFRYPACNAHAPYFHPWPAPLYHIFFFPHYLTNGRIFRRKVTEHKMCVLIFSTFVWNIIHSKKKWVRCGKNVYWSSCSISLPRVMKYYSPTARRNHGRPLKRLLGTWDRNGSTSGPTPWQIYDDDDDDDDDGLHVKYPWFLSDFN